MRSIRLLDIVIVVGIPLVILGLVFLIVFIAQPTHNNLDTELTATYWDFSIMETVASQLTQTNTAIEAYNAQQTQTAAAPTQTAVPVTLMP